MRANDVELDGVSVKFGNFTAVHATDLKIEAGEFFSVLGPSGCGKTTILRMISGFLQPTTGTISIGGESVAGIGPSRRPTAMIFQNLALFPLMTVWENVAFGLECRGVAKEERRRRAGELLGLVALSEQATKKPTELSGGQLQRVAVARALAVEPAVLLLDEPLSALDLKLRQRMRTELRAIQQQVGITFVYITHDQGEALTMSDRIAVMSAGVIEQVDGPDRLYDAPSSAFVATFVGENNVLRGKVGQTADGIVQADTSLGPVRAVAGPELDPLGADEDGAAGAWEPASCDPKAQPSSRSGLDQGRSRSEDDPAATWRPSRLLATTQTPRPSTGATTTSTRFPLSHWTRRTFTSPTSR